MIEDSQHGRGPHEDAPDAEARETARERVEMDVEMAQEPASASAAPAPTATSHDTADSIPAPSAAPGEPGEGILGTSSHPKACPCSLPLPCQLPIFRRGVCRTAYRKLSDAGLPIGEDGRTASNSSRALAEAARRLSSASPERMDALAGRMRPDARERLREALDRASGRRG